MVRDAGFDAGIVTNGYWATSFEDGLHWLRPIRDLGIVDFSVSDDEFHRRDKNDRRADFARRAAQQLGIPTGTICIEPPNVSSQGTEGGRGKPVVGGGVLFKGRAAEKLTAGLPVRPREELTTCPHEDLLSPERVHVDSYGNVHLCQGLSMGNIGEKPLPDLLRDYDAQKHPIAGPLIRGEPTRLVTEHGLALSDGYVDQCHLCYTARKLLLPIWHPRKCTGDRGCSLLLFTKTREYRMSFRLLREAREWRWADLSLPLRSLSPSNRWGLNYADG